MRVIGIDLGAKSAAVLIGENSAILRRDTVDLSNYAFGQRYYEFGNWLIATLSNCSDDTQVIIEEPPFCKNRQVYRELAGYEAVALLCCEREQFKWFPTNNSAVKRVVCGNGNANKILMAETARALSGVDDLTQDEADAYLTAVWWLREGAK